MSRHNSSTIFDVEEPSGLAFQDFSSTTIAPDLPSGRISPSASPNVGRGSANLYGEAERSIGNSISGATKSGGFLNLDFYTGYFDIDTLTVLTRCYKTLLPREDYVAEVLAGVPDLYGPTWVPTTLIFSLFLTSSLSSSINAYLAGSSYSYDFTRLGAATTLVYSYFLGLPVLIWAALKYWAGVDERSPVEMISIYGYASTIWIGVAWLALLPIPFLPISVTLLGTSISLIFLLRNIYPILSTSQNQSAKLLIIVVGVLHLGLAMGLWFGFMAGGGGALSDGGKTGLGDLPVGDGGLGLGLGGDVEKLLRGRW